MVDRDADDFYACNGQRVARPQMRTMSISNFQITIRELVVSNVGNSHRTILDEFKSNINRTSNRVHLRCIGRGGTDFLRK